VYPFREGGRADGLTGAGATAPRHPPRRRARTLVLVHERAELVQACIYFLALLIQEVSH
jgi:hypothetical protein